MRIWLTLLMCSGCLAQSTYSDLEAEHARALLQNPPGVRLTVKLADPAARYHLNAQIRLRLSFSSKKSRVYSVELAPGGSAASDSDDLVFQGPDMPGAIYAKASGPPTGVVCCGTRRRYVTEKPIDTIAAVTVPARNMFSNAPAFLFPTPPSGLKPGEYAIYLQTRRLMRGWPKSGRQLYFAQGDIVVTSDNILHITIVPEPAGRP